MKCPKCYTETPSTALCCPGCKLPTPAGRSYRKGELKREKPVEKAAKRARKSKSVNPVVAVLVVAATVIVCGLGSFLSITFLGESQVANEDPSRIALDKLRSLPSNEREMSVEDFLNKKVDECRAEGKLLEAQGWEVRPFQGSQYLVAFTFEERGNVQQRAEWAVDLNSNSFVPRTDLAASAYKR
jgi:hypothetical protein